MKGDMSTVPFAGMIGATNVYIVVFREGICTVSGMMVGRLLPQMDVFVFQFHFEDISEHTSRVRNRIIQLEETFHMSSGTH